MATPQDQISDPVTNSMAERQPEKKFTTLPKPEIKIETIAQPKVGLVARLQGKFQALDAKTKRNIFIGAGFVVALFAVRTLWGFLSHESTDDAFVTARVHAIAPRVMGTVQRVLVQDNQLVKKGDVLVEIDPRDYEVQLKIAQANYAKAHQDLNRLLPGLKYLGPDEKPLFDTYTANALVTEAQLDNARLQLEYTKVVAPNDGRVGKRTVEEGVIVQPGQPLLAIVEPDMWIVANFKETQLANIKVGQHVDVEIDALSKAHLDAKVDSIAPGSGATFSLLPPDNATGNFTKIVQRMPVKIVIDADDLKSVNQALISGMSANVSVHVW